MIKISSILGRFHANTSGSLLTAAALFIPAAIFGSGTAIDVSRWYNIKATAQNAADTTALAVVREASLAGMNDQKLNAAAVSFARGALSSIADQAVIKASSNLSDNSLKIDISLQADAKFAGTLGVVSQTIAVSATARMMGGATKICLLALEPTKNKTLEAAKSAKITAPECSFFVNSKDPKGLDVKDDAKLTAQLICTSGGYAGATYNFGSAPRTDCPPIPDPLLNRAPPSASNCDYTDRLVETGTVVLKPGVYCGGLRITNNAYAKLDPGIYVFRGSKLTVDGNATIEGTDVGLYFQDSNAQFEFDTNTTVSLSAPVNGPMAGILIYEDRTASPGSKHRITSNNAHTLLGTIYLPRGLLFIDSNKPISQKAAYTIIVASQIEMIAGPELFLNANYGATLVPVPAGVGPVSGRASLVK